MEKLFHILLLILLISFTNVSQAQRNVKGKDLNNSARFTDLPILNNLVGNWVAYSRESSFAAYTNFQVLANGAGIVERFEDREGAISMGLYYTDPKSMEWHYTWVGTQYSNKMSNGQRVFKAGLGKNNLCFEGYTMLNDKLVKDQIRMEIVNGETLIKTYEVSTDGGVSWDVESKFVFKRSK